MKRKLTSILLMSALLVGGASTFVSCKDYDGDQAAVTNANVKGLSEKLEEQIAALEAAKVELAKKADKVYVDDAINRIDGTIANLQSALDDVKAGVAKNAADIVTLNDEVVAVKADITAINTKLDDKADKADLDKLIADLKTVFGENFENALIKGHLAEYAAGEGAEDFTGAMVASLNNAIAAAGTKQFSDVTELFAYLDKTLPDTISALASKCAYLAGQDALLNDRIDSLVTSVNVDMVSNPIYGTFNTPFGIKSYVLAGFVGGQIEKADFNGVKVGGLAASFDAGNVYLTVNPAEVDAEGWRLNLVGRDGKPAPGFGNLVLVADNTPVTTISTRASNGLGGYVAAAELDDAAAAKVDIDKEGLKDVAKNVLGKLRGQEALDITKAVRTIYNQFNNIIPQYYAIKCQVKDGETKTKTYVSDYNIAAVTVKPLAYTTNIGVVGEKVNIPQIPYLQDKLGAVITKIENPEAITLDQFGDITFAIHDWSYTEYENRWNIGTEDEYVEVDGQYNPQSWIQEEEGQYWLYINTFAEYDNEDEGSDWTSEYQTVTDRMIKIPVKSFDEDGHMLTVTIGPEGVEQLSEDLNSVITGVVGDVNSMIDKAYDLAGNFDTKVIKRLNKIISAINSKLDNANQYLQPIMLAAGQGEAMRLSEVAAVPSVFDSKGVANPSVVLIPTSYTAELLAPSYKKSIKVNGTQVNVANLDGATKTVSATLKSGLNTIEYSTMDFYGNVVNKNYYIYVK